jgi:alpha-beta hydrolase superfamily lysophospholipase
MMRRNSETEPVRENLQEWLIRVLVSAAVVVVVVIAGAWLTGSELSDPVPRDIGRPPLDLEASNVTFASGSGALIHGWLSHGTTGKGAVILLHGTHGDRRDMLSRAEFLRSRGFSVLQFDFQAHGETRGALTSFGDRESRDVAAAIQYLRHQMPGERIGVIGVSMGAAAFVLADDRPPVQAVVLECMYPTIEQGVANRLRLRFGPFGPLLAPLVMLKVQGRIEIPAGRLRPIDRMSRIGAPVLIINGTRDDYTSIEDARALFDAASSPKEFWAVQGAAHVDLLAFAKVEYERRVVDFLTAHLAAANAS